MDPKRRPILIVEDDPAFRQIIRGRLAKAGWECDEACNGREALLMTEVGAYSVVITDLRMPHVNGHSLCVELLQRRDPPHIVVVTGVADSRLELDLRQRGINDIYFKPFNLRQFTERVDHPATERQLRAAAISAPADPRQNGPCAALVANEFASTTAAMATAVRATTPEPAKMTDGLQHDPFLQTTAAPAATEAPPLTHPTVVGAKAVVDLILWPTVLFAIGTGFGWALHSISVSLLLGR